MSNPPRYLIIGRVLKPWGVRGELKIEILTEFPERIASLSTIYLGDDAKSFSVERARLHSGAALLKLRGIDTPQAGDEYRDWLVQIARADAIKLPRGKNFLYELIGLRVVTTDGELLGEISDILDTGANDVYVVRASAHSPSPESGGMKVKRGARAREKNREILIPAIEDVVKEIAVERGEVVIKLLDGLL
ncbi:MAG: 16S rRNA processing protein RimM [Chloroflexi bacterium]|nr:16S rRNA processing protein RimM [Chloroflexota bacterium]